MPDNDQISVALWGPTQAGKTFFLAQLYLHQGAFRGDWDIYPIDEGEKFIDEVRLRISASEFTDPTVGGDGGRKVAYGFHNRRTGLKARLFVEDRAGRESIELEESTKTRLNEANGLVVLFDPERHLRELEKQIETTLGRLHTARGGGFHKDSRPIAVCLSKADCLIKTPEDLILARTQPREFVRQNVPGDILAWLSNFCSNFELFPISSVGVRARYGLVEPLVFYDENYQPRIGAGGEPLNLMEPFAWIFSQLAEQRSEWPRSEAATK
jgi:hypothetical protein